MIHTVVYADILVAVNLICDYFLLKTTSFLAKEKVKVLRILLSAVIGGISSLWIFLPRQSIIANILFRLFVSSVMIFSAFGFKSLKRFLRLNVLHFLINFGFAGAMWAFYYIFKPNGMVVFNSVVYFDVSAVFLTFFSVLGYIAVTLISRLVSKNASVAERYPIDVYIDGNQASFTAISDSGNSLKDVFGVSEIIIVEKRTIDKFKNECVDSRYRAVPCNTVSGEALLDGWRFDKAVIHIDKRQKEIANPILAVSKNNLSIECDAIINPEAVL